MTQSLPFSPEYLIKHNNQLRIGFVFCISLLLSAWLISIDPTINTDSILYLSSAKAFLDDGFSAAAREFGWPFFSIMVAQLQQLTPLPTHTSAQVLVSLCYALFTTAFVLMVRELGGGWRSQLFAFIIILCQPLLANYRSSIVRDPGFWAFTLLAFRQALLYSKHPSLVSALTWSGLCAASLLFRIEAIILTAATPLALLLTQQQAWPQRLKAFAMLISPALITAGLCIITIVVLSPDQLAKNKLITDLSYYLNFLGDITSKFSRTSNLLSETILTHSASEDANYALMGAYGSIFITNIIRAFTPIYAFLFLWMLFTAWRPNTHQAEWRFINLMACVVAGYLLVFTLSRSFLLERYSFQLFILLGLYLPFILDHFWKKSPKIFARSIIVIVLSGYALDTLITSDYKLHYIRDAADWIAENTPKDSQIVSDDGTIFVFCQREATWFNRRFQTKSFLESTWTPGTIYASRIKKRSLAKTKQLLRDRKAILIHEVNGSDGGSVLIFKKSSASADHQEAPL